MKFHFIHDWSKWTDPIDTFHYNKKVQSRHCEICNKVQVKTVKAPWNLWFNAKALEQKGGE